jgi:hypothetical protein
VTDLALVTSATELFDALVDRHGGARLSVVDREVIASMVKLLAAMRGAAAADLPKLVSAYAQLESMLPAGKSASLSPLDRLDHHIASAHGAPEMTRGASDGLNRSMGGALKSVVHDA